MANRVLDEVRRSPMLWLLVAVPALFLLERSSPESHTALFVVSVLAIVPLASLLSRATESVAARTGDAVGGLLNATLGNLTELVIALTALRAGMFDLVKASIAGAIVTNSLFMLGMALLLGGLRFHSQEYNRSTARLQVGMLLLAAIAMLVPSVIAANERPGAMQLVSDLSLGLSALLLVAYVLGLLFSLHTHRDFFASAGGEAHDEPVWPLRVSLALLGVVTVGVALVSEVFVESVQQAAVTFGMTPAFVGFIVVSLVGAAAEMTAAFSAARKGRLDLSIGIALGSSSQIALFVAPVLVLSSYAIAPTPMTLHFWPGAVATILISTIAVAFVATTGRSAWFTGVQLLVVYLTFAMTLYLIPPVVAD
ncbi:MAG: calcium/proton exchanger [Steroidobacteraceae bacterium]